MTTPAPHIHGIQAKQLDWVNPLRALALMAILLNHFVEEFARGPWFTNPSTNWPGLAKRLADIYPTEYPFPISLIQFLGWLGDSGPGVFILLSGFGLTWSALNRSAERIPLLPFYRQRLWRILPLYILCHFFILLLAPLVPGNTLTLASPSTLLSLLGLRFHDSLFFYINPSWWFIWLILQLYLVFPLLFRWLVRLGIIRFLVVTVSLTVIVRWTALLGFRYGDNLYYWMTGMVFGTRLAEFGAGMAYAHFLFQHREHPLRVPLSRVALAALAAYGFGLACSFTVYGSTVSNLLVSLGMSGIFYVTWQGWIRHHRRLTSVLLWVGGQSFGIFLIHQTPLKWTKILAANQGQFFHLGLAILTIAIAFPLAAALSRLSQWLVDQFRHMAPTPPQLKMVFVSLLAISILMAFDPRTWQPAQHQFYHWLLGLGLAWALALNARLAPGCRPVFLFFVWTLIFSTALRLFFLYRFGPIFPLAVGGFLALPAVAIYGRHRQQTLAWAGAGVIGICIAIALELGFGYFHPVEAGRWGEYPALEKHPTRIYALKPNRVTRLKYNNYDYILRTNSLGLPGVEITPRRNDDQQRRILIIGDAFTMPEGISYERAYPFLLQEMLGADRGTGAIEVINAGVTGYGPVEQLPQLRELLPHLKPDIVVYQFFVNEFHEVRLSPESRLRSIGLMPRYKSRSRRLIEQSQAIANLRRLQSRLKAIIAKKPEPRSYTRSLLQFYETGDNPYFASDNLKRLSAYLDEMAVICRNADTELVIYFVPAAAAVSEPTQIAYLPPGCNPHDPTRYDLAMPFQQLARIAGTLSIPLVDLTNCLKNHPIQPVYFPESWHWNQEGHKAVAAAIRHDLYRRNLI